MADKLKSVVIFDELAKRTSAETVKKVNGVYHFKIAAADKTLHSWTVDLKNGNGSVKAGPPAAADCTITIADADFVDLMTGKIDGQQAFIQGKLKIQGNMGLAMKLSVLRQQKASL